jgi:ATP-dependent Clp protease ATP-binding subunit ClpB
MKSIPFWKVNSQRGATMRETNVTLDPAQTGSEAKTLEATLRGLVVGQDEAIQQIVNVDQTYLTGLIPPGRPVGNVLFLGAAASGKTRMVEATTESLVQSPRAVIKIDCPEFQHSHEIAKLDRFAVRN